MDGYEPHDHIPLAGMTRAAVVQCGSGMRVGRGVPGVVGRRVGREGVLPGTQPGPSQDP